MSDNLPDPPVPADCNLQKYSKMMVDIVRLKRADIHVECTAEEKWYAFELWMASFHQVPASSLPEDEAKLAYLAGLGRDSKTWKRVRKGALRGFYKCSDGRIYHPVMSEICLETWNTMRGRKRGAELTNSHKNRQPVDKQQNQSRSPSRSIYNERTLTDTPSGHSAQRSAGATERKDNTSPLPPSLSTAGTGSVDPHPPRPERPPEYVSATLKTGAKIKITEFGGVDVEWTPQNHPKIAFRPHEAIAIRQRVMAGREPTEADLETEGQNRIEI